MLTTVTISKAADTHLPPGCSHKSYKYNYKYILKYKYKWLSVVTSHVMALSDLGGSWQLSDIILN